MNCKRLTLAYPLDGGIRPQKISKIRDVLTILLLQCQNKPVPKNAPIGSNETEPICLGLRRDMAERILTEMISSAGNGPVTTSKTPPMQGGNNSLMWDAKFQTNFSSGDPFLVPGDHPILCLFLDSKGHLIPPTKGGPIEPVATLEMWLHQKIQLEAHEKWEYNDATHIQKLVGLEALCPTCHGVKHIGRTMTLGEAPMLRAVGHLAKVNGWTMEEAWEHVNKAFLQWQERSKHEWLLDLTWLQHGL
jgi:hypothetical protein